MRLGIDDNRQVKPERHFVGRAAELQLIRDRIDAPERRLLEILHFYGVTGAGKSDLVQAINKSVRQAAPECPVVLFDAESIPTATSHGDPFIAFARKFLSDTGIPCPRFVFACAEIERHLGSAPEVHARSRFSERENEGFEAIATAGVDLLLNAASPGALIAHLVKIGAGEIKNRIDPDAYQRWVRTSEGKRYLEILKAAELHEIFGTLVVRFCEDLHEFLPQRHGKSCKTVFLIDNVHALDSRGFSDLQQYEQREKWLPNLWAGLHRHGNDETPESMVQIITFGQRRLDWERFERLDTGHVFLEQLELRGLSRVEADELLVKNGIVDLDVQAGLRAKALETAGENNPTFHPFYLALAVDTQLNSKDGTTPDPVPDSEGIDKRILSFLASFGDDRYVRRLIRLSRTPRFDQHAAMACMGSPDPIDQLNEWSSLLRFSFVQEDRVEDFYRIHRIMKEGLERLPSLIFNTSAVDDHTYWADYWQSRSGEPLDMYAGQSWFHRFISEPKTALEEWFAKTDLSGSNLGQAEYTKLIQWWEPLNPTARIPNTKGDAAALLFYAERLARARLLPVIGRNETIVQICDRAVEYCSREEDPEVWAFIQTQKGYAYFDMAENSRNEYLHLAVEAFRLACEIISPKYCYRMWTILQKNIAMCFTEMEGENASAAQHEALRIYNMILPLLNNDDDRGLWVECMVSLGINYRKLISEKPRFGDTGISILRAALKFVSREQAPISWAVINGNIGAAFMSLRTGDPQRNVLSAIEHFEAALTELRKNENPEEWVNSMQGLGSAIANDRSRAEPERLREAIRIYDQLFELYTETTHPLRWARAQSNLANFYKNLGEIPKAKDAFANACRAFRAVGMERDATMAEERARSLAA